MNIFIFFNKNVFYYLIFMNYMIYIDFNIFNILILFIAVYIGIIIIFISDNKVKNLKYMNIFILFILPILTIFYITTKNYIFFFIIYECFLIPSIYLVFLVSPNKRSLTAVFYFLIWTQLGSFFVFIAILYILNKTNSWFFFQIAKFDFSNFNKQLILFLFFIGFGIKIPTWPFYYWLTKTHVEAPTFFSIYLSGFLVKIALFGLYKFIFLFNFYNFMYFYLSILFFSVCDSSIKFFSQVDLKKLVAYSTIQEMNLICIGLFWGTYKSFLYTIIFSVIHAFLSTIFFYLIDNIYKRYTTRNIYNITNLFTQYPNISFILILSCLNYNGFPFSLKFFSEILILNWLLDINLLVFIFFFLCLNWIGTISFTYLWFRTLFGINKSLYNSNNIDILTKEKNIFFINFYFFYQFLFFLYFFF